MSAKGILYIISAASGTGKTSLAKALARTMDNIIISISHTTRPVRRGERHGESYFFIDDATFEKMIAADEFLEYAKVFDHYYGTSKSFVNEQLNAGMDVLLDIDWQGARQIRAQMPESKSIFLLPPSKHALRQRLESRKRDPASVIEDRLRLASDEIAHCNEFDYIVINDKFSQALKNIQAIVTANRLRGSTQMICHKSLLKDLTRRSK
jgi:guanylate kinase